MSERQRTIIRTEIALETPTSVEKLEEMSRAAVARFRREEAAFLCVDARDGEIIFWYEKEAEDAESE